MLPLSPPSYLGAPTICKYVISIHIEKFTSIFFFFYFFILVWMQPSSHSTWTMCLTVWKQLVILGVKIYGPFCGHFLLHKQFWLLDQLGNCFLKLAIVNVFIPSFKIKIRTFQTPLNNIQWWSPKQLYKYVFAFIFSSNLYTMM